MFYGSFQFCSLSCWGTKHPIMNQKKFYVYIVTNSNNTVLYTGVTNNLKERIIEHYTGKEKSKSFTSKYHCYHLLFYESFNYINNAIAREKEIKGWVRKKKLELIRSFNPEFKFLNEELFGGWPPKEITSRLYWARCFVPQHDKQ